MAYEDTILHEKARLIGNLRETIRFFACCIKSGEQWTESCERHMDAAMNGAVPHPIQQSNIELGKQLVQQRLDTTRVANQLHQTIRERTQLEYLAGKSKRERDAALAAASKLRERCSKHIQEAIETKQRHIDISLHLCRENQLLRTDNREMTNTVLRTIADNETLQREMDAIKRPWHWSNVVFSFLFTLGVIVVWKLLFG